jgi:hypothetical protein
MSSGAAIARFRRPVPAAKIWLALCCLVARLEGSSILGDLAENDFTPSERALWSLQPVRQPEFPLPHSGAAGNPIDAFVLEKLQRQRLSFAPRADKIMLLRRVTLDLTGLPPALEETEAFLADYSGEAFARVVDRLLASPRYGERWARHWLDLARYAESEGFKSDETRPNAWRYRDYVIAAFNADKPYDRFIREQIAGDELWPNDPQARIATAFNRHYPDESNARNLMQRRQEILNDITDTVGAVFVGLTFGCARCHDHKFDPIRQRDYYCLQAFFANTAAADHTILASADAVAKYKQQQDVWEEKTASIREELDALEEPARVEIIKEYVDKYPDTIQAALNKPSSERTPFECQMVAKAKLYLDPESPQYIAPSKIVAGRLKGECKKRWDELQNQLQQFAELRPAELPMGTGVADLGGKSPPTFVLRRGNWDAPKQEVEPGFLAILDPRPAKVTPAGGGVSTGRRTELANILTDPHNPLTARVMVNRIWQYHFGRGIVETPSDFGRKGALPSHPELLDWLASEFMAHGWSIKHLHRLILNSETYQQSSIFRIEAAKADPDNKLLWRFPRQRLPGEAIRDASLAVAGTLNLRMGGPSVFPELPLGMRSNGHWLVSEVESQRDRRSVYIFVRRNTPYPLLQTFDGPDTHESCPRRNSTISPLQALFLLNDGVSLEWAQRFAARVLQIAGEDPDAQVETAWRLAFSRLPSPAERAEVRNFYDRHQEILRQGPTAPDDLLLPPGLSGEEDRIAAATLVDLCHMLLNSNEFVYLN